MSEQNDTRRVEALRDRMVKNLNEFAKNASIEATSRRAMRFQQRLDMQRQRHDVQQEVRLFPPPKKPVVPQNPSAQQIIPFAVAKDGNNIKVSKGKYQFGPLGTLTELAEVNSAGTFAYFEVVSNWTTTPTVSIYVSSVAKNPYELDNGTPQKIIKTYIPIGKIVNNEPVQLFSGNVLFSVWLLEGRAGYWGTNYGLV